MTLLSALAGLAGIAVLTLALLSFLAWYFTPAPRTEYRVLNETTVEVSEPDLGVAVFRWVDERQFLGRGVYHRVKQGWYYANDQETEVGPELSAGCKRAVADWCAERERARVAALWRPADAPAESPPVARIVRGGGS